MFPQHQHFRLSRRGGARPSDAYKLKRVQAAAALRHPTRHIHISHSAHIDIDEYSSALVAQFSFLSLDLEISFHAAKERRSEA